MDILVTGASRVTPTHLKVIESEGHSVAFMQQEKDELPLSADEIEVVFGNSLFEHHSVSSFTNLKMVQATSAGLDRLPIHELSSQGVRVFPARDVYSPAIAEFVIMLLLQIYKSGAKMLHQQEQREWRKNRQLRELTGLTACIVGFGSIGKAVAKRLQPFGVSIISVGRDTPPREIDERLSLANIVILAAPLTPDTYQFMNRRRLMAMRHDSVLINVARGQLIDESALIELLDRGHFYGVGLDVFEEEPLAVESPLWGFERVLITPHNSFVSDQTTDRLVALLLRNLGDMT